MRSRHRILGALGLLTATVLAWSCRDALVGTAPRRLTNVPPTFAASADESEPGANGRAVACSRRTAQSGHAVIGPEGGTLVIGRNRLIIPAGALGERVQLSGYVAADTIELVHLAPHGLRFLRPVRLLLDASGCGLSDHPEVGVAYVDNAGSILEWIDATYDPHARVVSAPIEHFSGYLLAF